MSERTPRLFRFTHEAMRTEWMFLLVSNDPEQAAGAAQAAFQDVDDLESELSRFKGSSDIGRIATLNSGESMGLGLAAWDVLSLAKDVWSATGGAFDTAIGPLYELWRNRPAAEPPTPADIAAARARSGSQHFELIEDGLRIRVLVDHLKLDLGAIGKGYALDIAADALRTHWEIENALLVTGGGSTIFAMGSDPDGEGWQVNAGPDGSPPLRITDRAVSASGFIYQGAHIINPRTALPVSTAKIRVWAAAPTAALSDALSTAFLVMERSEIDAFCRDHPEVSAIFPA